MANSKYEYVRSFEQSAVSLQNTYIVVRIDGRGFHKFSVQHGFEKPNDRRALDLMNAAATAVVKELAEICCAYGASDEFSFVFGPSTTLFGRRESKILTTVVSIFTSYYIHLWPDYLLQTTLAHPSPSFDGRIVLYPSWRNLRDYLSWRQVDCHINNLYNTTFWALVQRGGMEYVQAGEKLKGTLASDKNEILFSQFQINYSKEPEIFKKGSFIHRDRAQMKSGESDGNANLDDQEFATAKNENRKEHKGRRKTSITIEHIDIIKDDFWQQRPWLLPHPS